MTPDELKLRTKVFALRIIKLVDAVPRCLSGQVISRQLLRSATSIGANYRAACRAQSRAEFGAKLSIVVEETDETCYWLELMSESGLIKREQLVGVLEEAGELLAIFTASRKTAKFSDGSQNAPPQSIGNRQSTIVNSPAKKGQPWAH